MLKHGLSDRLLNFFLRPFFQISARNATPNGNGARSELTIVFGKTRALRGGKANVIAAKMSAPEDIQKILDQ